MAKTDSTEINPLTETRVTDGVLLLDHYDEMADMLKESFRRAGFAGPVLVIEDKGFLPPDVLSVFRWFCEDHEGEGFDDISACSVAADYNDKTARSGRAGHKDQTECGDIAHHNGIAACGDKADCKDKAAGGGNAGWKQGNPRYFNQIELPDYWEISSTNNGGEVHDLHHLRGRIFYAQPTHRRLVSEVDWLDEKEVVRCTDHYDNHGILYARTAFNRKGERFCRSWFDASGHERVVENYVTGDIIVSRRHKTYFYKNRTRLVIEMIRGLKAAGQRIFYNSLSTPLFVSESFPSDNILFWQEGPRTDIPGNMQMILKGQSHTRKIYVQNQDSFQKLLELGASEKWIKPFGFVYPFVRENYHRPDILICTNSDQIEELEALVTRLPQMVFHIAAITEMSARLLAFGRYPNVRLYPVIKEKAADELFQNCDYYFDINHGGEILSGVKRAFLNNQLILGFENTIHRHRYIAREHIYHDAADLCALAADPKQLPAALSLQRKAAMSEETDAYRSAIASG
jgi:accessory Sec system glycosyltransferase GtfB